jgi:hypothetical protein
MRRLLRLLLPVIVLVPPITMGTPAAAVPGVPTWCFGPYKLTSGLGPSNSAPFTTAGFTLQLDLSSPPFFGNCTASPTNSYPYPARLEGWLTGWCGAATGGGYFGNGQFQIVWAGSVVQIAGSAIGSLHLVLPDTTGCPTSFAGAITAGADAAKADSCTGYGQMFLATQYTSGTTGMAVRFNVGACTSFQTFQASGVITGSCGSAGGTLTSSSGHTFSVLWTGNVLVFYGDAVGAMAVTPDFLVAGACRQYLGAGSVFLLP